MKLRPADATEYLKDNPIHSKEEFVINVTAEEFDELHACIMELRGQGDWIEPFSSNDDLNAFLREVVRADLQLRFNETFPPINGTPQEIVVSSRRSKRDRHAHSIARCSGYRLVE